MASSEDIEPVTSLKSSPAELIARARRRRAPIVITQNGGPTAELQDVESYERQRRALLMLKLVAQGEADYAAGRTLTDTEARRLAERFRPRRAR
jgi:prevent-host-death family protein